MTRLTTLLKFIMAFLFLFRAGESLAQSAAARTPKQNPPLFEIAVLIIVIVGLFLYQIWQRLRNQRAIAEKNRSMEILLREKENLREDNENLLEDKEVLMQEVHHRVRNNLQIITSLLESQSAFLEDSARLAIQKSQHRVQALSLIHKKLYVDDNVIDVEMDVYLRELITYLRDSFDDCQLIVFDMDLDPVLLNINQAVSVGLIVNEAVTNSLRFAFPEVNGGRILISLKQKFVNQIVLTLTDNGIGITKDIDPCESNQPNNGLGMNLINGLSKSLGGTIKIESGDGTKIELIFFNDKE